MIPSERYLEACARVGFNEKDFLDMLKARLEKYRSDAVKHRDEVPLRWAQGRAQEVEDIIDLIEHAPEHLRKAQRSTSQ